MDLFEVIFDEVINERKKKEMEVYIPEEEKKILLQEEKPHKPYLINGELRIPMNSDPKYHWWNGGQDLKETLEELNAPPEVMKKYVGRRFED